MDAMVEKGEEEEGEEGEEGEGEEEEEEEEEEDIAMAENTVPPISRTPPWILLTCHRNGTSQGRTKPSPFALSSEPLCIL